MSCSVPSLRGILRSGLIAACALGFALASTQPGWCQFGGGFFGGRAVGGIFISPEGALGSADPREIKEVRDEILKRLQDQQGKLKDSTELRMVSLKGLEAEIAKTGKSEISQLPEEVRFLAGLQRIQYVFLYPEENDIVLAGPAEGWKIADNGLVVGVTTGLPVLHLDDLLVALRGVDAARTQGITCSIDPTQEGLQNYMRTERMFQSNGVRSPDDAKSALESAMGPQQISFTGISPDSRLARVLVGADYRMKRLAMDLDPVPVKGLKSFISMASAKSVGGNAMPRWWLACNYDTVAKSEDNLAWEIRGKGVKAMTEDDFVAKDGTVKRSGKANVVAQKWANEFTEKYMALAEKEQIFGELRNVMDMCVIAALIRKENMVEKTGLSIPTILAQTGSLENEKWPAPKQVSTKCSITRSGNNTLIWASGGVEIDSWRAIENTSTDSRLDQPRAKAHAGSSDSWWWN